MRSTGTIYRDPTSSADQPALADALRRLGVRDGTR